MKHILKTTTAFLTFIILAFFTTSIYPAFAAISVDKSVSTNQSTAARTIQSPLFTTTQTNEVLYAFITSTGPSTGAISFSAVTGGGLTWTLVKRVNTRAGTSEIWKANAVNIWNNTRVTATRSSGSYTGTITVVTYTGADISATGTTGGGNGATGAQTASLTTTRAGSWVYGVGNDWDGATARTVGTNQTIVNQYLATAGDTFWVQRQNAPTPDAATSVTINDTAPTNHQWNLAIAEILASPAATPSPTVTPTVTPTPTLTPTVTPPLSPTSPPPANTKTPVLVVTTDSNQFSKYYPEILKAEGLNSYSTSDINAVTAATLANYDVVILGEMPLTAAQVTLFSNWTTGGGNLIAMKPDKQLASLLGLTDASSTLADKYLKVDTSSGPGVGIVSQSMQFHSSADLYTTNGATALASLYSDANTATTNPAVTIRSVGTNGGQAAAFTYDLAKSVIYTHQGNPSYAGQDRDPDGTIRAYEQFFPDYVDLNKVQIPQADEQQRLLANMITQMDLDNKPLPRFWYLPNGIKAAIVYTLDDHTTGSGTFDVFNKFIANSPTGCSLANWECKRGTSWAYTNIPVSDAQAGNYNAQGFEMGVHVSNNGTCNNYTSYADLDATFVTQLQQFQAKYTSLPAQTTHRYHCVVWSDWVTQAKVNLAHNIRYNMDYYYWPSTWVNNRAGLFTGSGIPMKFADTDGTTIDVYQGVSQLVNENGIAYATAVNTLLTNATGANGYYGIFGTHDDYRDSTYSDVIVNSSNAFNVPVITAKQALTWLDGRNNSSFGNFSWNGTTLNFTVTNGAGSQGIQAMLPTVNATNGYLDTLTRDGSPVTFTTSTIKGISYAFFPSTPGAYVATYNGTPPSPTPTLSSSIVSLWNNTIVPGTLDANDSNPIEVGLKFKSDVDGQITGMKFYKGPTNTGTHTGHLWSSTGTLLATATFSSESASGWQQVSFATPVAVTANTTYVISYHAPVGQYSADANYFASNYDNAPLHAPSSVTAGGNGVYSYGASGTFPSSTFNSNNYWVDVVMSTGSGPANSPTPTITPTATPTPSATPTPTNGPSATPSPTPPTTTTSIWSSSVIPANPQENDPSAVSLGVKFTSDVAGQITGIRFYKGVGNTGVHTGSLWSSTGTRLATVTFSGESASGWQQALFSSPVAITAGTTYIASYFAPNGNYAGDNNYFTTAFNNIPLHALATGTSGGNGIYMYGSDVFPTNTYNASNYWVDVVFQY